LIVDITTQEKDFPKRNLLQRGGNTLQELLSGAPFPLEVALEMFYRSAKHHVVYCNNKTKSAKSELSWSKNALRKIPLLRAIQVLSALGQMPF
jgi:hypothetical protein